LTSLKRVSTRAGRSRSFPTSSLSLSRGDAVSSWVVRRGKSTLLYIMGALEPPTRSTVTLDGQNHID